MKFLAVDYGQKRVGLAISDESETFALPFDTLEHKSSKAGATRLTEVLLGIMQREEIAGVVFGLPKDSSGEAGEMEILTRAFAEQFQDALQGESSDIEFAWWDERFSTASVLKNLRAAGIKQKNAKQALGKESIDARAAAVILQDFLDARKLRASFENSHNNETEDEDDF